MNTENSGRLNTGDDASIAHTLRRVKTADVRRGSVSPLTTALYGEGTIQRLPQGRSSRFQASSVVRRKVISSSRSMNTLYIIELTHSLKFDVRTSYLILI